MAKEIRRDCSMSCQESKSEGRSAGAVFRKVWGDVMT